MNSDNNTPDMEQQIRDAFNDMPGSIMDTGMQSTETEDGGTRIHVALPGGQDGISALYDQLGGTPMSDLPRAVLHGLVSAYALGHMEGSHGKPNAFKVEDARIVELDSDE